MTDRSPDPGANPRSVLRDAAEDIALAIGAVAASYRLDDRTVRALLRRLERILDRALERLGPAPSHPAVEALLRRLDRRDGE